MKRRGWGIAVFWAVFCLLLAACAGAESSRKLTLMIYMCGSNLESNYGSASLDIQEMLDAGVNGREASVLVMTGGSNVNGGSGYFSQETTGIYEIGPGRSRRVWQSERAMNMGSQETLEWMLQYGRSSYPAEKYALILWDHGGGPLEGVCWDETHEMDHLSLAEVSGALENMLGEERLSWIGFDACLMGSLEVAGQLAPHAEYMIASQETEPASGWNYAFLKGIEQDADGAATGRRIVDAYFEDMEESRDILTLACVDLDAAKDAIASMDAVFTPLEQRLGKEQFLSLSGLRMSATGFGKASPGYSESGYDLVDAQDLVSKLEKTDASENFLHLLDAAVVYSRSNEAGAGGISLYHPYANKDGYEEKWGEGYQSLAFSTGYQQYVASFGSMLTGERLFKWLDLIARSDGKDEEGNYLFELPLTAEQAENVVSAQLLILRDNGGSQLDANCVILSSIPAELGEDGILRAAWDGKCLYAETEGGALKGPVPFLMTNDGKENTVIGNYIPKGSYDLTGQVALFEMDAEDHAEYPTLKRTRVWDEMTQSFSSRMRFTEEGYGTLMLYNFHRQIPEIGADQILPDYETWENTTGLLYAETINLPNSWRFTYRNLDSGEQRYAMFRIVDSQQNVVCSIPAALPNENREKIYPTSEEIQLGDIRAEVSCTVNSAEDQFGLQMDWEFENTGAEKVRVVLDNLLINDERESGNMVQSTVSPGATSLITDSFGRYDLSWIETLESISGTISITPENGEKISGPFRVEFDHGDLSGLYQEIAVLVEGETNGVQVKLIAMDEDEECGWHLTFFAENASDTEIPVWTYIMMDEYCVSEHAVFGAKGALPAGHSRIIEQLVTNYTAPSPFAVPGYPSYTSVLMDMNLLQSLGKQSIQDIRLMCSEGKYHETVEWILPMKQAIGLGGFRRYASADVMIPVVRPPEDLVTPALDNLPVLRENNAYRIVLRRVITGSGQLALSMEIENRSGLWLKIRPGECQANGSTVETNLSDHYYPPYTSRFVNCVLSGDFLSEEGLEIETLSLEFHEEDREEGREPCVLTVTEPLRMGGISWMNGEKMTGETVQAQEIDLETELNPRLFGTEMAIPDHAADYRKAFEVSMDPEERAQVRAAKISLVRPGAGEYLQVISIQDWIPEEGESLRFNHPGQFPTVVGDESIAVWISLAMKEDAAEAKVGTVIEFSTATVDTVTPENIHWQLRWEENQAVVTDYTQDSAPYGYQSDILTATFSTLEVLPAPDENGILPHIADMPQRDGFEWYMNRPGIRLQNKPLQLALRPTWPEEELYFLISITRQDGTRYSLPLIPYQDAIAD